MSMGQSQESTNIDETKETIKREVLDFIAQYGCGKAPDEAFDTLAKHIFAFQFERNLPYRAYCMSKRVTPQTLANWMQIPPMPVDGFKMLTLTSVPEQDCEAVFTTSGTTHPGQRGRNFHPDLQVWDESMIVPFRHFIMPDRERIRIVSRERIAVELNKIVASAVPSRGFDLLERSGLLALIFPEMQALKGVERVGRHAHKDNFYHTLKVLDNVAAKSDDLWLRWAAVLHDIAKPLTKAYDPQTGWTFHSHETLGSKMVPQIFRRMKLPMNEHMKFVQKMVFLHLRPIILSEDQVTDSAVRRLLFEAGDDIEKLMTLCEADITSGIDAKVKRYMANFRLVREKMADLEERDRIRNFQPPVTGEIIMQTYCLPPCRAVGEIKERIKNAILDGEIRNDYDEAYALMERLAAERGLTKAQDG